MKFALRDMQIASRFLTVGFTSSHDAKFLNEIANAGSELGNFFYIDTSKPGYKEEITKSLSSSLEMAIDESGIPIEIISNRMEYK